jgi:hypothetical protein
MQNVIQWFILDDDRVRLSVIQLLLGPRPSGNPIYWFVYFPDRRQLQIFGRPNSASRTMC